MTKTAILLFSRAAKEEADKKKYARLFGKKSGIALAAELIRHTQQEASISNIPVVKFFSDQQKGQSFGDRLTNAIEETFALGYDNIIISGTDSPSVNSAQFINISRKLQRSALVLGPSNDGGVYIIGFQKSAYCRNGILKIPWLTNEVFKGLKDYAFKSNLSVSIETPGDDMDNLASLAEWQNKYSFHWLSLTIRRLFEQYRSLKFSFFQTAFLDNLSSHTSSLRGPPQFQL